jgi:hypothetical protein
MPVVNRVYTIRDVYRNSTTGRINIRLGEIVNKSLRTRTGLWEPGFPAERFRPLPKLRVEDFAAEGVSA